MARPLAPHGTYSAYKRHLRDKSPVCEPCERARDERTAEVRENRRPEAVSIAELPVSVESSSARREGLERNLVLVSAAMERVAEEDPSKLAPLSKRHSELLLELSDLDGSNAEEDPFDVFLSSTNVIGISTAPSRKQA